MALLSRKHRREVEELVREVEKIETAMEPRFQEHFVNAMGLPNRSEAVPAPLRGSGPALSRQGAGPNANARRRGRRR